MFQSYYEQFTNVILIAFVVYLRYELMADGDAHHAGRSSFEKCSLHIMQIQCANVRGKLSLNMLNVCAD